MSEENVIANRRENPPRYGEGDRREAVVEGAHLAAYMASEDRQDPSVSPADCHLPVPGRNWRD
jgi:hypothetical protein